MRGPPVGSNPADSVLVRPEGLHGGGLPAHVIGGYYPTPPAETAWG